MTNKFKMPIITGCALGLLVFIAFYYFDFRKFNSEIDKLFYRQYGIIAGKYQNVTGSYRDSSFNYSKALLFTPEEPPFVILALARSDNGFSRSELTMPNLKYQYKAVNPNSGGFFTPTKYLRPDKITDPKVIYRYAFLRAISSGKPPGSHIQQDSYSSIVKFPTLKSKLFIIKDVTFDNTLNGVLNNLHNYGMSFDYYDGTSCNIICKNSIFVIGRNYKNVILYSLGFLILGGVTGILVWQTMIK